jgi:Cdc6-like AAA superfamily ATPase
MSGDARRALEICRRAAEFADYRTKQSQQNKGTFRTCIQSWKHIFANRVYSTILSLCLYSPVVMVL